MSQINYGGKKKKEMSAAAIATSAAADMPSVVGMEYSGSSIMKNGEPIHSAEKLTHFDNERASVVERIDGDERRYDIPSDELLSDLHASIDEDDIYDILMNNERTHRGVIERLMDNFVKTNFKPVTSRGSRKTLGRPRGKHTTRKVRRGRK